MPRIRSVHPDICKSETMAVLLAVLERTFVRLWTHCDDEGRCVDNPRLIKAALFPLNDEITWQVVDHHLAELETAGLIVRYGSNGKRFLAVRSWAEFQHPQKPKPSLYPPPPDPLQDEYAIRTRHVPDGYAVGEGEGEGVGEGYRRGI